MNLPNVLTLSRIVFAFFIVLMLLANTLSGNIAATLLFTVASITDFYDGYLAKKQGLISNFGKIMDPIADKILMLCVFGALAYLGMVQWWMVIVIALREVAVTVSRLNAMTKGQVLGAEFAGKLKTVVQMSTIGIILIFLIVEQCAFANAWFYKIEMIWRFFINLLMLGSVFLTVASGIAFFKNNANRI